MGAWGWFAMSFTTLIALALAVAVAVLVARAFRQDEDGRAASGPRAVASDTAEKLLAERFARGEIDDEEYQHRLMVLRGTAPGPRP
ncbi:SHOCT domain-containing protein [Streptomyces erythrochromogenes]|uniref:SHOCT domain-containing protein n=1 Tax=Streptomyces erythrochromogenes TaxID=285574 RepID=UPI0033346081